METHREWWRQKARKREYIWCYCMCCRSKTWQSHDQRHLIILELHCSFNPSERNIFYWGKEGNNVEVANRAGNAVTSSSKCILLIVAWHFEGSGEDDSIKPPCVRRMAAELMGLETQMCHKSLSTQHWIVLLFFSLGLLGKRGCWMWPDCNILHLAHRSRGWVTQSWATTPFEQDGLRCLCLSFAI